MQFSAASLWNPGFSSRLGAAGCSVLLLSAAVVPGCGTAGGESSLPKTPNVKTILLTQALDDPGTLLSLQYDVEQTFYFRVTGSATGSIWGTDIYTADSALATAVVHAGILDDGRTNIVQVTMKPGQSQYTASDRNGVSSYDWDSYYNSSYVVESVRGVRIEDLTPAPF